MNTAHRRRHGGASSAGARWASGSAVEADARNQGIGRRLIEQAISHARATNTSYLYLYLLVDPTNSAAIALYRRTGFVENGERDHIIAMRLDLGAGAS